MKTLFQVFRKTSFQIREENSVNFEKEIIIFLQSLRTPFLDGVFKVVSYFFDYPLVIALGIILFACRKWKQGVFFLILEAVGWATQTTLKRIIMRPRPYLTHPEIENILEASSSSFPSGHSVTCMMAVVILFVMIKDSNLSKRNKGFLYAGLGLMLFTCLINRMYLGQHYITDCLGAFIIALVIGAIIIKFFYYRSYTKIKEEKGGYEEKKA